MANALQGRVVTGIDFSAMLSWGSNFRGGKQRMKLSLSLTFSRLRFWMTMQFAFSRVVRFVDFGSLIGCKKPFAPSSTMYGKEGGKSGGSSAGQSIPSATRPKSAIVSAHLLSSVGKLVKYFS